MSWEKNTINLSHLDATLGVLDDLDIPYEVAVIGEFAGRGLNDGEGKVYTLRRLQYRGWVILEVVAGHSGCDIDDVIYSSKFRREDEPKNWQFIRWVNDDEHLDN